MASVTGRGIRWLLRRYGAKIYALGRDMANEAANQSFSSSVAQLGAHSTVHHPVYLINGHCVFVGSGFWAGPGLRLEAWESFQGQQLTPEIMIGSSVGMNWNVHIGAIGRIEIGNHVLIGSNVLITDHSHGSFSLQEQEIPPALRPLTSKGPVIIEDNVWIGEGVCILSGVRIGRGAVIGANAVVTHDVAPGEIVGGVPARHISSLSTRETNLAIGNVTE